MTADTEGMDLALRYDALQQNAIGVNHQVRIMVIPGNTLKAGQSLTVKPIEVEAMTLEGALEWAEGYVASDEAKARGDLYRKRDEAHAAYLDSMRSQGELRKAWREAEDAIDADLDRAAFPDDQDDAPVVTTVGELRATLAGVDTDDARKALAELEGKPDDQEVAVTPDDLPTDPADELT